MPETTATGAIKSKTEITGNSCSNAYDAVPYASFPYPYSSPERMYTIGKLFGMQPVDCKKARVLELGCSSGGNILHLASRFPESEFVGIDSSQVQINIAMDHARNLGLKNMEFRCQSIFDITDDLGKFDYIITHGILSWVSPEIQNKVFEVCNQNLSRNGIAYISYNTYPGWNLIKSLREMMLYHTAGFTDPAKKVTEAANLLEFIRKAGPAGIENNPYLQIITNELKMFEKVNPSYLYHDHLEEHNEPYYFHQFMRKAQMHSLQYLGEVSLSTMFIGNLAQEAAATLGQIANDIVRVEQYMDFIRNRRFRCTLLVHDSVSINRVLNPRILEDFYLTTSLHTDSGQADVSGKQAVTFKFPLGNASFTSSAPAVIAALMFLIKQRNKPVSTREIMGHVRKIFGEQFNSGFEEVILSDFLRLVFTDVINIYSDAGAFINQVSATPAVSVYARYQATNNLWVTNQRSEKIDIDLFTRVLVQYLDGKNGLEDIHKKMFAHFDKNEMQMNEDGKSLSDREEISRRLNPMIDRYLQGLADNALLVA
jgi:methyltransferase-like protein/SAM-dependent methyltransferase